MEIEQQRRPRGWFVGLATLDVVSHVDRAPEADEKVTATWQLLAGGGPALNAAVTFAALGGEAVLVSRVGEGAAADMIRADLARCGVRLVDLAAPGVTPPVSSITVEADGTRRIVGLDASPALGAAADGGREPDLDRIPAGAPDVVLVDGHHPDLAHLVLERSAGSGIPCVMDAGRWKAPMAQLIPLCAHVIASSAFRLDGRDETVEARLTRLADRTAPGPGLVAMTAGEGRVHWTARAADGTTTSGRDAPPQVAAVDTLGAGDALHGAYAWAVATGHPDPLRVAMIVASGSCAVRGTREWLSRAPALADSVPR